MGIEVFGGGVTPEGRVVGCAGDGRGEERVRGGDCGNRRDLCGESAVGRGWPIDGTGTSGDLGLNGNGCDTSGFAATVDWDELPTTDSVGNELRECVRV